MRPYEPAPCEVWRSRANAWLHPANAAELGGDGELPPVRKARGGARDYAVGDLLAVGNEAAPTIGYARVSAHEQKADRDRQHAALKAHCASKGWRTKIIRDLGSGMNYRKKGR